MTEPIIAPHKDGTCSRECPQWKYRGVQNVYCSLVPRWRSSGRDLCPPSFDRLLAVARAAEAERLLGAKAFEDNSPSEEQLMRAHLRTVDALAAVPRPLLEE